jgi:hypothetical protein
MAEEEKQAGQEDDKTDFREAVDRVANKGITEGELDKARKMLKKRAGRQVSPPETAKPETQP